MSGQPDSDLDITAELPQLSLKAAADLRDESTSQNEVLQDGTAEFPLSGIASVQMRVDPSEHWDLMDELISVRDRIVGLENGLAEADAKFAKLQTRYDQLQSQHAELLTHGQSVSRDRDRLADERLLLLTARQQLQDQLEQRQAESAAALQSLRQQLEQQEQAHSTLSEELATQQRNAKSQSVTQTELIESLSKRLDEQQQRSETLLSDLHAANRRFEEQHGSAATLARSMAQELLAKDALQTAMQAREQAIAALDGKLNETRQQLASAEANGVALSSNLARHQQDLADRTRHLGELQHNLKLAEERIERLLTQVDLENTHWRSAEQDKERLRQIADSERQAFERTRRELAERQAEISAFQERVSQMSADQDALNLNLSERVRQLQQRDESLLARDQELQAMQQAQADLAQREVALNQTVQQLRDDLHKVQTVLQERVELHTNTTQALDNERQQRERLAIELKSIHKQTNQLQLQLQKRDTFVLDQNRELEATRQKHDELQQAAAMHERISTEQAARISELTAALQKLQDDTAHKSTTLQQVQEDLEARNLQQGANARQIEGLQVELRQQVEAMNAIRRDIHQVALQTRSRDSEVMIRTLNQVNADGVVYLLNKASMIIGRGSDSDICIKSDAASRQHACLRISRDAVIIEDMGSTNGCYVNGKRIKRHLLKDGDKLEIGDVALRFAARPASL